MVRCYYMDSSNEDKRLPHELSPPQNVDLETLYKKTGVLYFKVSCTCVLRLLPKYNASVN